MDLCESPWTLPTPIPKQTFTPLKSFDRVQISKAEDEAIGQKLYDRAATYKQRHEQRVAQKLQQEELYLSLSPVKTPTKTKLSPAYSQELYTKMFNRAATQQKRLESKVVAKQLIQELDDSQYLSSPKKIPHDQIMSRVGEMTTHYQSRIRENERIAKSQALNEAVEAERKANMRHNRPQDPQVWNRIISPMKTRPQRNPTLETAESLRQLKPSETTELVTRLSRESLQRQAQTPHPRVSKKLSHQESTNLINRLSKTPSRVRQTSQQKEPDQWASAAKIDFIVQRLYNATSRSRQRLVRESSKESIQFDSQIDVETIDDFLLSIKARGNTYDMAEYGQRNSGSNHISMEQLVDRGEQRVVALTRSTYGVCDLKSIDLSTISQSKLNPDITTPKRPKSTPRPRISGPSVKNMLGKLLKSKK